VRERVFRFEDPPPVQPVGRRSRFADEAQKLRENPGRWALVTVCAKRTNAGSVVRRIGQGLSACWHEPGDFEATARSMGEGDHRVYARYLGDGGHDDE
jgi:hypothetical protein